MLQQILKESTKNKHALLEQLMFVEPIMAGTLTLDQYRQILTTNYLVHKHFEHKLHSLLSTENAVALTMHNRVKSQFLKEDMLQINAFVHNYIIDNSLPQFENEAAAFGALYVLEGATLGGNVIVKKLQTIPHFTSMGLNFNYYQAYGDQLGTYWKEFCKTLNDLPITLHSQVIEGANNMFDHLIFVQKNVIKNA